MDDNKEDVDDTSSEKDGANDTSSDEDDLNGENFDIWKQFVKLAIGRKQSTVFDILRCFIHLYYLLTEDGSYQEIVQDVEKARRRMDYFSALEYAIDENKDIVIHEVENANDCRDCFHIWCFLSYIVEEDCGSCLNVDLKFLMTVFHYMSLVDTIQYVVVTVKQILDD